MTVKIKNQNGTHTVAEASDLNRTSLTLTSSLTSSSPFTHFTLYKLPGGLVRGLLNATAAVTVNSGSSVVVANAGTIPEGWRPGSSSMTGSLAVEGNGTHYGYVYVNADGSVNFKASNNLYQGSWVQAIGFWLA